jgi:hypothetical protein
MQSIHILLVQNRPNSAKKQGSLESSPPAKENRAQLGNQSFCAWTPALFEWTLKYEKKWSIRSFYYPISRIFWLNHWAYHPLLKSIILTTCSTANIPLYKWPWPWPKMLLMPPCFYHVSPCSRIPQIWYPITWFYARRLYLSIKCWLCIP